MVLAFAAACEDPSNVGLGLLDEQGGEPVRISVDLQIVEGDEFDEVTGATRTSSGFVQGVSDVLAGQVTDPLFGCLVTTAFLDVTIPSSAAAFRDNALDSISLNITPSSSFGDTTATLTMSIYELLDEFEGRGLKSDTLISAGTLIGTVDFVPTDSLVAFDFPQQWVDDHDSILRDEDYQDQFHGFRIEVSDGAIIGLNASASDLVLTSSGGDAEAAITQIVTHIEDCGEVTPPSVEEFYIQDGRGNGIKVPISIVQDSLPGISIARANLSFSSNKQAEDSNLPPNFVRPMMTELRLYGIEDDGDEVFLRSAQRDSLGSYSFTSFSIDPGSETFLKSLKNMVLGSPRFEYYLVKPGDVVNTLSSVSLYTSNASDEALKPQLILTVLEDL